MKDPRRVAIGARIQALRKQMGWSQRRLANAMDERIHTIVGWESGRNCPNVISQIYLASIFSVPLSNLHGTVEPEETTGSYMYEEIPTPVDKGDVPLHIISRP